MEGLSTVIAPLYTNGTKDGAVIKSYGEKHDESVTYPASRFETVPLADSLKSLAPEWRSPNHEAERGAGG